MNSAQLSSAQPFSCFTIFSNVLLISFLFLPLCFFKPAAYYYTQKKHNTSISVFWQIVLFKQNDVENIRTNLYIQIKCTPKPFNSVVCAARAQYNPRAQLPIDHNLTKSRGVEKKKNKSTFDHRSVEWKLMCVYATRCASRSRYKCIIKPSVDFCRVIQKWWINPYHHRSSNDMNFVSVFFFFKRYQFKWRLEMRRVSLSLCVCVQCATTHSTVAWNWRISTAIYLFVSSEKWIGNLFIMRIFFLCFRLLHLYFLVNWNLIFLILFSWSTHF